MKETPSVSVVIPTYNGSDRIERAIKSALNQTLRPLEIIIVDDGSAVPVDPHELKLLDNCIRVIHHETNRGGSAARNTGIDAARGEWVALLDADDEWMPTKLFTQFSSLGNRCSQEKIFSAANVLIERPGQTQGRYNNRPPGSGEDLSRYFLVSCCTFQTSTLLMPAHLARTVRFDERLRRHQDWDFVLRLIEAGAEFVYCHEPLCNYWDGNDPNRVSQQKSYQAGLVWLALARHRMKPDAATAFYFRTTFRQFATEKPLDAVLYGLKLTLSGASAVRWVLRRAALGLVGGQKTST